MFVVRICLRNNYSFLATIPPSNYIVLKLPSLERSTNNKLFVGRSCHACLSDSLPHVFYRLLPIIGISIACHPVLINLVKALLGLTLILSMSLLTPTTPSVIILMPVHLLLLFAVRVET